MHPLSPVKRKFPSILCEFAALLFFLISGDMNLRAENRDTWQQPEKVMDVIGVKAGMVVGEIGAGEGYFTLKLARRVGAEGKIFANDIKRAALDTLDAKCRKNGIRNVRTILGKSDDPLFVPGSLDLAVMVYVLHEVTEPVSLLQRLKSALKPGALLAVLDRDPAKYKADSGHFLAKKKMIERIQMAGYALIRDETFLPRDALLLFRPDSENK